METERSLAKTLASLLCVFPAILFFSYQPRVELGVTEAMNLELSLPLVWLAGCALLSLFLLPRVWRETPRRVAVAAAIIPCYAMISLVWSSNPLRTFLSAGILACLAVVALALPAVVASVGRAKFGRQAVRWFLIFAALVSAFAWMQCILDVLGADRSVTLLCEGCTYQAFGFPHPNGFAIEPQFFGNLLIAPTLLCYYSLLYHDFRKKQGLNKAVMWALSVFFTVTLFLSFSRGAIYAFLAGLLALGVWQAARKKWRYFRLVPLVICSFAVALCAQGVMAEASPTNDTFVTGVTKAIHQLSLGKVDIRQASGETPDVSSRAPDCQPVVTGDSPLVRSRCREDPSSDTSGISPQLQDSPIDAIEASSLDVVESRPSEFDGYVERSTDERVSLTEMAVDVWNDEPRTVLFGTGLGGAGTVLYQKYSELGTAKQIVQNEYVSLLLEVGVVGVALILAAAGLVFSAVKITDKTQRAWILTLALMYGLTLLFFSGLPNALHIYLLPVYALVLAQHKAKL